MNDNAYEPASPMDMFDFQPGTGAQIIRHQFHGLTKFEQAQITFTAAWIGVLGQRHAEEGYADSAMLGEAARLGYRQAEAVFTQELK